MTSSVPFWSNDPTILLNKNYIFEIFPKSNMTFEQKLNSISRLVIILSILGACATISLRILLVGLVTLILLFVIYQLQKNNNERKEKKEPFSGFSGFKNKQMVTSQITNPETLETFLKNDFQETKQSNPYGNVLLTDIMDNPERKSAPPSFNNLVYEDITKETKKLVQSLNPEIRNTDYQLYGDLGEKYQLDQSQRQFYSMPNTKVCNDQGAFGQFLYGTMYSSKESNLEGAIARVQDSYRYTLY
jgi:hypothetical protein